MLRERRRQCETPHGKMEGKGDELGLSLITEGQGKMKKGEGSENRKPSCDTGLSGQTRPHHLPDPWQQMML